MAMQCPACYAEMGPNDMQCPICLRPRSRKELMESLNQTRREEDAQRKRPFRIAGALVLVVALGYVVKQVQQMGLFKPAPPPPAPKAATPPPAPALPSLPT